MSSAHRGDSSVCIVCVCVCDCDCVCLCVCCVYIQTHTQQGRGPAAIDISPLAILCAVCVSLWQCVQMCVLCVQMFVCVCVCDSCVYVRVIAELGKVFAYAVHITVSISSRATLALVRPCKTSFSNIPCHVQNTLVDYLHIHILYSARAYLHIPFQSIISYSFILCSVALHILNIYISILTAYDVTIFVQHIITVCYFSTGWATYNPRISNSKLKKACRSVSPTWFRCISDIRCRRRPTCTFYNAYSLIKPSMTPS